jgi:four helix bundle protein
MAEGIRSHRELLIWERGMSLTDRIEELVSELPLGERGRLGDQMIRAARSVPANIAEGHGRFTPADFARFLTIAHGSLTELDTHLEVAKRRAFITAEQWTAIDGQVQELARMIRAFRASLRRR